jgi:hypothetical protein
MPANPNWARWIFASVAYHLKQVATVNSIPVLIEHLDERSTGTMEPTLRAEIRITGPYTRELSHGFYRIFADVNVLLTSRYEGDQKNAYDILIAAGHFHTAMDGPIPVWNYGGELNDYDPDVPETQLHLGCLTPRDGKNDLVRVLNFGQIDKVSKVRQTAVDARYVMDLQD